MRKLIIFFVILFGISNVAFGDGIDIFTPQKPTPAAIVPDTISKPDVFYTGNDLTRHIGSFHVAVGELLYLKGRVTDAFGVPIEGAVIKIWQTNSAGRYQSLLKSDSEYIDKNFIMSGTAKTDNLGRYGFKTIFPGFTVERAPHINVTIFHEKFVRMDTEIYFENHPRNTLDPYYMSYSLPDRQMLTAKVLNMNPKRQQDGKIAIFNVVLNGIHSYKGY